MTKFSYLTKEGFRNLKVNKLMTIASITVLFSCLLLVGVAFMIMQNIESFISGIESENVIMVYAKLDISDYDYMQLGADLKNMENVESVESIEKEDAYEEILSELDESLRNYLSNVEENPLPDAFKVTVRDMTKFSEVVDSIKRHDNILRVHENSSLARELASLRNSVGYISLGIIMLLLVVSLFIISNTIKVTMFSRRLEISIMKSVGATKAFIRWPFMVEGIIIGILSGALSLGAVWLINDYALSSAFTIFTAFGSSSQVHFADYASMLAVIFIGVGILTGIFGSSNSIRKYLKERKFVEIED